jgi:hypothetical protein
MQPDIIIAVRFLSVSEGGRKGPIRGGIYGCPMIIDGEAFECRLLLDQSSLQLGETYEIKVKFMNPDIVLPKLSIGKEFTLWEGKTIAKGQIKQLF